MRGNLPIIQGFNKTSEAGFNTFAVSIFLGGCNLRCPYCMNANLVHKKTKGVDIEEIKQYVTNEKVGWVMISGGEPTITEESSFLTLLEEIKSWGCKIGMSTNGTNSEVLRTIIGNLNYVALDFKSPKNEDYDSIAPKDSIVIMNQVYISQSILAINKHKRKDFDYEIRTTLYPPFISESNIGDIGSIIRKDDKWVLQQFRHSKNMLDKKCLDVQPYTEQEVKEIMDVAKIFCNNVTLRYV